MCNRLIPLTIAIVVIIVICALVFRHRYEDEFERGCHRHELLAWITISVITLVIICLVTEPRHSHAEYGLRERYDKAVDNFKARSAEKKRVRIAKQHGLQH